jgi:hypothetical protein
MIKNARSNYEVVIGSKQNFFHIPYFWKGYNKQQGYDCWKFEKKSKFNPPYSTALIAWNGSNWENRPCLLVLYKEKRKPQILAKWWRPKIFQWIVVDSLWESISIKLCRIPETGVTVNKVSTFRLLTGPPTILDYPRKKRRPFFKFFVWSRLGRSKHFKDTASQNLISSVRFSILWF